MKRFKCKISRFAKDEELGDFRTEERNKMRDQKLQEYFDSHIVIQSE
jgi:hypothetical protein